MNSVTSPTTTPPIVAPTIGMRSRKAISSASGIANGTPRSASVTYVVVPAIRLMIRLPAT
jgi:hypothetical protein